MSVPSADAIPKPNAGHDHQRQKAVWGRWTRLLGMGALVGFVTAGVTGCIKGPEARPPKPAEVIVTTPVADQVSDYQDYTGRLAAIKTVNVRPRASGYVLSAPFKEGDRVKKDQVLFKIDPQSYQADFNQAEANLSLAEADEKLQAQLTERSQQLIGGGAASREELDQNMAALAKARANVAAMRAARDKAKLNLSYTNVLSPVTGRISQRMVDPGNLVNADTTILTTVVTEDPLYVGFDVDERTYLDLVEEANKSSWLFGLNFPVRVSLANEKGDVFRHSGTINFIDNQINGTTGTIRLRATIPNPGELLKPGLFVRIRLPIGAPYKTLLVPQEALQHDQGREYVFVTKRTDKKDEDGKPLYEVEYRKVEVGQAVKNLAVIKKGLAADEKIIVVGMQRVRPKAEVKVTMQAPPKPPSQTKVQTAQR